MEQLLDQFHSLVNLLSHGNSLAAAGVTMWLLTVAGVLLRRVPRLILTKFKRKFIVSMTMNKAADPKDPDSRNFLRFLKFVSDLPSFKYDLNRKPRFNVHGVTMNPGLGFHWFFYKRRYYWFTLSEVDSQGVDGQKERIRLSTFGLSLTPLTSVIDAFEIKPENNVFRIWGLSDMRAGNGSNWCIKGSIPLNNRPHPIVNDEIKAELFDRVEEFINNKDWYSTRGLPYKLTFMLMGPPGTGKTTLAREVAIQFGLLFHVVNLKDNGVRLPNAITDIKAPTVLLIDDFEDCPTLQNRLLDDSKEVESKFTPGYISQSNFFGVLDGPIPLHNIIVILNTNHPQKLDPAIYRPGRVDHQVVVGPLTEDKVVEFIDRMYGEVYAGPTKPTTVAVLSNLFNRNKHDYRHFIKEYNDWQDGLLVLESLLFDGSKPQVKKVAEHV